MPKLHGIIMPVMGIMLFAGGCCVGPAYQTCDVSCDPCYDTCDTDDDCDVACDQTCGYHTATCNVPCICIPNPLHWIGGLVHRACRCDSGCGEIYWGGWYGNPPGCDPCGNWVGGCNNSFHGCGSGCQPNGAYTSEGYPMPNGRCDDCVQTAGIPRDSQVISRTDQRQIAPSRPTPKRAPIKAAPKSLKQMPQTMRPYYNQRQR